MCSTLLLEQHNSQPSSHPDIWVDPTHQVECHRESRMTFARPLLEQTFANLLFLTFSQLSSCSIQLLILQPTYIYQNIQHIKVYHFDFNVFFIAYEQLSIFSYSLFR